MRPNLNDQIITTITKITKTLPSVTYKIVRTGLKVIFNVFFLSEYYLFDKTVFVLF